MSTSPASRLLAATDRQSPSSVTSSGNAHAAGPILLTVSAGSARSVAITCAPRSANAKAIACPIPWPGPVTKATRPSCVLIEVFTSHLCSLIQLCFRARHEGSSLESSVLNCSATHIGNRALTARQLGLHELDIESDGDLVTNQNAAGLEGGVPGQSEVLSIDLCGCGDRNSRVAPGILRGWRWPFNGKADVPGNATDGQVAFDRQFSIPDDADALGFEVQGR